MATITVVKHRTNVKELVLAYDVSQDVLTSQIRKGQSHTSELIAEWDVSFKTDGTDGRLLLTLDDTITGAITETLGYMDLKRITGGEPVPVFDYALQVEFKEVVTE